MNLLVDQHCTTLTDSLLNTELELVRCVGAQVQCVGLLATTEKVQSLCLLVDSRILFGKYRVERIESYIHPSFRTWVLPHLSGSLIHFSRSALRLTSVGLGTASSSRVS